MIRPDSTIWTPERAAARRSRRGPPLCSTTFGGVSVPFVFGGGGGGGFGGYTFVTSSFISGGNANILSNAQRTITSAAGAGDLMVGFSFGGPGYAGQSGIFLRQASDFGVWSSTSGILAFRGAPVNRFVAGIQGRFAAGDATDDCLFSSVGPFPFMLCVAVFSGNVFGGTLANLTADNEDSQILGAANASMFRENGPPGGFAITLKTWLSCKQTGTAQAGDSVSGTDQAIQSLVLNNAGDNGFNQGGIVACGYKFEELAIDTATGVWPLSSTWTGDEFSIEATFKSGDS